MKKKLLTILIFAAISGFALTGCGGPKPETGSASVDTSVVKMQLVGTWKQITEDGSPSLDDLGIPSGYIFYVDGTGKDLFWDMEFTYTVTGSNLHITYKDTLGEDTDYIFELSGDILYLTRAGDEEAVTMLYQKEATEEEK